MPGVLYISTIPSFTTASTFQVPVITRTKAVIVQTTTVSVNGSSNATSPSLAGFFVFTAEWAIGAEPIPASLENAARLIP